MLVYMAVCKLLSFPVSVLPVVRLVNITFNSTYLGVEMMPLVVPLAIDDMGEPAVGPDNIVWTQEVRMITGQCSDTVTRTHVHAVVCTVAVHAIACRLTSRVETIASFEISITLSLDD